MASSSSTAQLGNLRRPYPQNKKEKRTWDVTLKALNSICCTIKLKINGVVTQGRSPELKPRHKKEREERKIKPYLGWDVAQWKSTR